MNFEHFFEYRDASEKTFTDGFSIFSLPHFLWLAAVMALIVVFIFFYRRGSDKRRDNMRKAAALILILFEIAKQCVISLSGAVNHGLPLEICSFAEYTILADAMWQKNRFLKHLLAYAFMPAAVVALLLPTAVIYPPVSFFAAHQFLMHGLIVAYIVARYSAGEIEPRYVGVWITTLAIGALIVPIYFIDKAFGESYMFLTYHYDNPALKLIWDLTGGKGGILYILGLTAFVVFVFHITYGIYVIIRKSGNRSGKKRRKA